MQPAGDCIVVELLGQHRFDGTRKDARGTPYTHVTHFAHMKWFILDATDSEDGRQIQRFADIVVNPDASRESIAELLDALNAKAIDFVRHTTSADLVHHPVHVVTFSNAAKHILNGTLAGAHAARHNCAVFRWESEHKITHTDFPLDDARNILRSIPADGVTRTNIPPTGVFFDGIEYVFRDSMHPNIGRRKNDVAIGKELILDPREQPVPVHPNRAVVNLRHPPVGIVVHVESLTGTVHREFGPKRIVVQRETSGKMIAKDRNNRHIECTRTGIPLLPSYAVDAEFMQVSIATELRLLYQSPV
jgi:hypothetical protein